jgi:CRISPR-associated protein Csx16
MMNLWIVSRHPGAVEWIENQGWRGTRIDHLEIERVRAGDVVIGTLPANLAAEVCTRGARYLHLALKLPASLRGKELSTQQMAECGAELRAYDVREIPFDPEMMPGDTRHD